MKVQNYESKGDGFWVKEYGVRRWNHTQRAGTYLVVHTLDNKVADFFNFYSCPHVVAVVDDFGSLVPVGVMQ